MDYDKLFARRRLMILMDGASIALSMLVASYAHTLLRSHFDVFKQPPAVAEFMLVGVLTMPLMLSLVAVIGLHRQFERPLEATTVAWDLIKLHGASLVGISLITFLTQVPLNRSFVGLFLLSTFWLMFASRIVLESRRRRTHADGHGRSHLLVVGSDPDLVGLVVRSAEAEYLRPEIVGIVDCSEQRVLGDGVMGLRVVGSVDDLAAVLHERTVDEVVIATRALGAAQCRLLVSACDDLGTPIRQLALPEFHDGRRIGLDRQYGLPFVTLVRTERSTEALALKRLIDVFGALAVVLLLSPFMLAIALLIVATMGRPVLFSQDRTGYRGRSFRMHKFRTMINGAERQRDSLSALNEMGGPVFKLTADPRITPLGTFLRKFSLDELPQLFNVLGGSMSLVGPRPLPVAEQQAIAGPMRRRLSMKPGITGLWQVSGRSDVTFDEWMLLDLEYLDTWSNLQDIKLLIRTIPAVLLGDGAR